MIHRRLTLFTLFTFYCCSISLNQALAAENALRPALSAGPGIMVYRGDVGSDRLSGSFLSHAGFQVELEFLHIKNISISAFYLSGKASANNYDVNRPLNFESNIFSQGLQARYDFIRKKKPDATITPYISAGVEFLFFNSYTDLKDENGTTYHYWNDGTIRSLDQYDPNAIYASLLYRDYVYETNIRDANLDGFGKYRQNCVGFPIGAGFRMRLTDRSSIQFTSTYHFVQSDLLDGITNESYGERRGDSKNDHLIFTSAVFRYDFGGKKRSEKSEYSNVDFKSLESEDADQDGIPDVRDAVIDKSARQVDAAGRPIDYDRDGIPDYRDKEPKSSYGALVNEDGVTVTQKMMEDKFRQDSLAALPAIVEYLHSVDRLGSSTDASTSTGSTVLEIPLEFRPIDTNRDGFISPPEIGVATEKFLGGQSTLDADDFYRLIDFYFRQYR